MKAIAAVDQNWAIGNEGALLTRIPADQKMFRAETLGKTVILGRKTLETFPMGRPLDGRDNIILTTSKDLKVKGARVVRSVQEALEAVADVPPEDVYVIGGESIYRQFLPYCDEALITRIDYAYQADAYFPNLDEDPDFILTGESEEQTYFDIAYRFLLYERKRP